MMAPVESATVPETVAVVNWAAVGGIPRIMMARVNSLSDDSGQPVRFPTGRKGGLMSGRYKIVAI